jgi:hypothetical protein
LRLVGVPNNGEDIEWQVVYVGSAEDQTQDQELDAVLLPADTMGRFKFVLQVPAPDSSRIPAADVLGVTIVLLTCSYNGAEFIRVGYYVNNEHPDFLPAPEPPAEDADDDMDTDDVVGSKRVELVSKPQPGALPPTSAPDIARITRTIAAAEPRITKFPHAFDFTQPVPTGTLADPELSGDGMLNNQIQNDLTGRAPGTTIT